MDSNKTGQLILKLRKDNNLTQAAFAKMFGVTYQAVSKWENGKNIPDILILQEICKKFNVDINELLDGEKQEKRGVRPLYIKFVQIISLIVIIGVGWLIYQARQPEEFHFKTISSGCDQFTISGSIAYNSHQSHIYISRIEYCSGNEPTKFNRVECRLYKGNGSTNTRLDSREVEREEGITLEEFLRDVRFHINDFSATCPNFINTPLFLQIFATDFEGRTISHTVYLNSNESCPALIEIT